MQQAIDETLGIQQGNQQNSVDGAQETNYNCTINNVQGGTLNGEQAAIASQRTAQDGSGILGTDRGIYPGQGDSLNNSGISENNVGEGNLRVSEIVRINDTIKAEYSKYGRSTFELIDSSSNPQVFVDDLMTARSLDKKNGWCVSPETVDAVRELRTITSPNGEAGLGVAKNGNITAVFKNPNSSIKNALDTLIPAAIEMGGTKLDCYGEGLALYYTQYSIEPVAQVDFNPEFANEGWDPSKGTPPVYVMMYSGKSVSQMISDKQSDNYKHFTIEDLRALPKFNKDSCEAALAYRDSLPEKQQQASLPQPERTGGTRQSDVYTNSGLRNKNETIRSLNEQQLESNPDVANYKTQTHADTTKAAQARIDQNGYAGEYDRLLNAETWDSADLVEAQMALEQFFKDGEWLVIALRAAASLR